MTTGEGLDSLARCFFSLITVLARSYIDIFGMDGEMDLGVEVIEENGEIGVEGIVGMDGVGEGSVDGVDVGGWEIRIGGGDTGVKHDEENAN